MIRSEDRWGYFIGPVQTWWSLVDPRTMTVSRAVTYVDRNRKQWCVPEGTGINGASVPWLLRRLFPAYIGYYRRATVIHDWACSVREEPSPVVHRMFYEAMRCDQTPAITACLMYAAVRVFGPRF